ncbi:MAG TPA: glycosyltransferase family 39 protein [Candidatus Binatia bacterium]|nr:glycosyltransferase family 39 protein [Candidatus Binatia bacterium]
MPSTAGNRPAGGGVSKRSAGWVAAALLATFALQASVAVRRDSVTIDEFANLPAGLYAIYTGDLSRDPINPPHTRMLTALPLLLDPPAFDPTPDMAHWSMGYLFMQRNEADYQSLFVRGRSVIILLALALGWLVFHWATELYGRAVGPVALALFAFSPDMLAHGHLVTLDMAGALGFTLTAYATWRMLERETLAGAACVGVAFGVASLLKLSGFVLAAAVAATVVARFFDRSCRANSIPWHGWIARLAVMAVVGIVVINVGYGFDGSFALLSTAMLDPSGVLADLTRRMPGLRLPFPRPFVEGVDMVLNVGKAREPSYFLLGNLTSEGWWYYHLVAFAAKTPLPALLAYAWALGAWLNGKSRGVREYALVLPVVVIFATNTLFNSLQIGVRHVLPAHPLLMVLAAPWIARALERLRLPHARRMLPAAAAIGLLWYVAGTLSVAPRYLQYFNEIAGGPDGGHRVLVDSNIDWGQDLIRLREYMTAEGLESVHLAYFGRVDPRVYGVRFVPLERTSSGGRAVISATFLMGRPYFWFLDGRMRWVPAQTYAWLREREPIARVGSMFVFDLP